MAIAEARGMSELPEGEGKEGKKEEEPDPCCKQQLQIVGGGMWEKKKGSLKLKRKVTWVRAPGFLNAAETNGGRE